MNVKKFSLLGVGIGIGWAAALWAAPSALADPGVVDAPQPAPVVAAAADVGAPPPAPAPDPLAFPRPAAEPAPPAQPAAAPLPAPPAEVPHLVSPENLPPGSTMDPSAKSTESPRLSYLRDLWQGVRNQEISAKEALIWGLSQRSMTAPYPDQAPGPNVPITPADPAPPPPPPAPAPPPLPPPAAPTS